MVDQLVVHDVDPRVLRSIFPAPGRNDPCHCGSGEKYKRCCMEADQEDCRTVNEMMKEAVALAATLPRSPLYPEFNPLP